MIDRPDPADVARLVAIAAECDLHVDFLAELARPYALLRVAREEAGVVGFALAWRAADELHLTDVGVTASARRRGFGRELVAAVCHEGRGLGARIALLEVRASNEPALALYGSLGFEELDRRAGYYADSGEDAIVMQLRLS